MQLYSADSKIFFDTWKKFVIFKHELSPSKPLLRSTQSLILGINVLKSPQANHII